MPVLVLGMHRSGTSVLTRLVSALGLEIGDEDVLMGPSESNVTGHFEVTSLTELNDELLRHLGGRWSGPPTTVEADLVALADGPWGERARTTLGEVFGAEALGQGRWVWKDPRVCLLLPFWRAVLGEDDLAAVLVVREPIEVARSLQTRDGIGIAYGVALWERHQRAVLDGVAGLPTLVTSYDDLLADPVAVARSLHGFLPGTTGPTPGPDDVAGVVDPGHRHHRAPDRSGLPSRARALLEATRELAGTHDRFPEVDPGPETPGLQLAFDEHARMAGFADLALQYRPLVDQHLPLLDALAKAHRADAAVREQLELLESTTVVRTWRRLGRVPRPPMPPLPPAPPPSPLEPEPGT